VTRWTRSEPDAANAGGPLLAQTLRFPTWDRQNGGPRQLTARIYRPASGTTHPVLLLLPGGSRQPRQHFDPLLQYLVRELGYVVIAPALRGSGGQGRSFAALDDNGLVNDPVRDVGSLLVWAGLQTDLDRSRFAIMGSGDSSQLALASLAQFGDRLRAAIAVDGSLVVAQPQAVRGPVLIVRGVAGPLSSRSSAEQLMWRLRAAGAEVWLAGSSEESTVALGADRQNQLARTIVQFLQSANR